jgi:hypothetical protein
MSEETQGLIVVFIIGLLACFGLWDVITWVLEHIRIV